MRIAVLPQPGDAVLSKFYEYSPARSSAGPALFAGAGWMHIAALLQPGDEVHQDDSAHWAVAGRSARTEDLRHYSCQSVPGRPRALAATSAGLLCTGHACLHDEHSMPGDGVAHKGIEAAGT